MHAQGHVRFFAQNTQTGKHFLLHEQKNLILFEGADIIALLMKGDTRYKVSGMYVQYKNSAPTIPAITRADGRTSFNSITGVDGTDWLRIPIISEPLIASSGSDYVGNIATFFATTASSTTQTGESPTHNPFTAGTSQVYSVALVSMPVLSDSTKDKVFSRLNLASALTVPTGFHLVPAWTIKFI